MEVFLQYLIDYGVAGMFISAFLAGSILPLSSEFVLAGLVAAGVAPFELLLSATLGNTLGSALNYGIGRLGREAWIERWVKVTPEQLERGKGYVRRFGFWGGFPFSANSLRWRWAFCGSICPYRCSPSFWENW